MEGRTGRQLSILFIHFSLAFIFCLTSLPWKPEMHPSPEATHNLKDKEKAILVGLYAEVSRSRAPYAFYLATCWSLYWSLCLDAV